MTAFEADVDRIVTRFVAQLAELAQSAAHEMVIEALEHSLSRQPRARPARPTESKGVDADRALRVGLRRAVKELERLAVTRALDKYNYNVTHAARALRLNRVSLQRSMRALGISKGQPAGAPPRRSRR